jgi:hypothetical protein
MILHDKELRVCVSQLVLSEFRCSETNFLEDGEIKIIMIDGGQRGGWQSVGNVGQSLF